MEPIVQNTGALTLAPRSISVISVQVPTKLNLKHLYQPDAADDLPSGIIPLAVDHKIDHKYPKLLKIPLCNTEYNTIYILRKKHHRKLKTNINRRFQSQQYHLDHRWYS